MNVVLCWSSSAARGRWGVGNYRKHAYAAYVILQCFLWPIRCIRYFSDHILIIKKPGHLLPHKYDSDMWGQVILVMGLQSELQKMINIGKLLERERIAGKTIQGNKRNPANSKGLFQYLVTRFPLPHHIFCFGLKHESWDFFNCICITRTKHSLNLAENIALLTRMRERRTFFLLC